MKSKELIAFITIGLYAIYVALLITGGRVNYYINPRFNLFISVATWVTLVVVLLALVYWVGQIKNSKFKPQNVTMPTLSGGRQEFKKILPKNREEMITSIVFLVLMAVIFLIPPTTLSADIFSNRAANINSFIDEENISTLQLFGGSTAAYSMGDWITLFNTDPDLESYVGKDVDIEGFITEVGDKNVFRSSKFAITCCAVDAQPLGLLVFKENWADSFEQGDWVATTGVFEIREVDGREELVVVPETLEKIDEPEEPYIY